jgi:hypothetical protein
MGEICSTLVEKKNACKIVVRKPDGKKRLRRHRCEDNVTEDRKEIACGRGNWTHLA